MPRPPGPRLVQLPLAAVHGLRRPHRLASELRERYGDSVRLGVGPSTYVYLFGLDANELVLGEHHEWFTWREAFKSLEPVDGPTALVLSDGEEHRRRRRLVQPAFATRRLDTARSIIEEEIDRVIDALPVGETVDLYERYRVGVRRIVTRVLFGDALAGQADRLGEVLEPGMRFVSRPVQLQVPGTPAWLAARRARRAADAIVDTELARRRNSGDTGSDVLSMLMATELSDAELRDQVVSLIAAGYETTSAAVAWAILELLRTPGAWDRARHESTTGSASAYVNAVIDETLRLWAPAVIGRRAEVPLTHRGYEIPAGRLVLISPYVTHRDPAVWGDDADVFRPERWLTPDFEPSPYAYFPFGGSYRKCLGFALALLELRVAVTRLVERTHLTLIDTGPMDATGLGALRPVRGVHVRVEAAH